ncbi:NACHT, LRR and PYD domains-containing protein 1a allele 5 [Bombina bombina]|uniref:NACHT, LRR and PYD domains-containing protein 1a allele 5 n=1 Tax=Bombina bombina TaxID=8345 RepID=UPI00235B0F3A|nr:NACHT, LRR and PYD domains-containing protein 1a allele 5 [Bombina bombina]
MCISYKHYLETRHQNSVDLEIFPEKNGSTYRIRLESSGLFYCSKTGIKFQVTSPVTIEYELDLDPHHHYKKLIQEHNYVRVGPIFNVKISAEPGVVSAVYLPHYVCLKGGDVDLSRFKVGHFKDDNMILETAATIEPYYVVVENPDFSLLGALYMFLSTAIRNIIPIHGAVLVYCKCSKTYIIHLYLIPNDNSIYECIKINEEANQFCRLDVPPQTKTLYCNDTFSVKGPANAMIQPKELNLLLYPASLYPYSKITFRTIKSLASLQLESMSSHCEIWQGCLTEDDIKESKKPRSSEDSDFSILLNLQKKLPLQNLFFDISIQVKPQLPNGTQIWPLKTPHRKHLKHPEKMHGLPQL